MNCTKNMDKKNLIKKLEKNIKRDGSYPSLLMFYGDIILKNEIWSTKNYYFFMTNSPTIF